MNQKEVNKYIKKLANEGQKFYSKVDLTDKELKRKGKIEKEIDQYFDMLKQIKAFKKYRRNHEV